ncbi:MAG: hypothetical protein AB7Q00_07165 [Phycisphaerales bacterium]
MSCNCGCHSDKPPATGWRRYVPLIVAGLVVVVLVVGAVFKDRAPRSSAHQSASSPQTTANTP